LARFKEEVDKKDLLTVLKFYLKDHRYDKVVEELYDRLISDFSGGDIVLSDYESALVSKSLRYCITREGFRIPRGRLSKLELGLVVEPRFYYSTYGIEEKTKPSKTVVNSNMSLRGVSFYDLIRDTDNYRLPEKRFTN